MNILLHNLYKVIKYLSMSWMQFISTLLIFNFPLSSPACTYALCIIEKILWAEKKNFSSKKIFRFLRVREKKYCLDKV